MKVPTLANFSLNFSSQPKKLPSISNNSTIIHWHCADKRVARIATNYCSNYINYKTNEWMRKMTSDQSSDVVWALGSRRHWNALLQILYNRKSSIKKHIAQRKWPGNELIDRRSQNNTRKKSLLIYAYSNCALIGRPSPGLGLGLGLGSLFGIV